MDVASRKASLPGSYGPVGRLRSRSRAIQGLREVWLVTAIYGMLGWIYVALCSLVAPYTLALPLTHLVPWLREDTSGVLSFVLSFFCFLAYRLTRPGREADSR